MGKPSEAALKKFEATFSKKFSPDVLRRTSEVKPYEVISTGSLTLDFATGVGGLVEGRLIEYWGPESVGKSTMALLATAEAQKKHQGKVVGYIDMEQSLDLDWAVKLGVDLTRMYHVQPDSAEDVADILKEMLDSGLMSLIVVDSIGGMVTETEQEKDAGDEVVGKLPKVVTRMIKIAAVEARKSQTTVLLINQVRANLAYGADTTTPGGHALRHGTTMRMKFRRTATKPYTEKLNGVEEQVGVEIAVSVEKNKVAPPKRVAIFNLFNQHSKFGQIGVDQADEAATLGVRYGFIQQTGGWYTTPDGERHNGRDKVLEYLRFRPEVVSSIREQAIAMRAGEVIPDVLINMEDLEAAEADA